MIDEVGEGTENAKEVLSVEDIISSSTNESVVSNVRKNLQTVIDSVDPKHILGEAENFKDVLKCIKKTYNKTDNLASTIFLSYIPMILFLHWFFLTLSSNEDDPRNDEPSLCVYKILNWQ